MNIKKISAFTCAFAVSAAVFSAPVFAQETSEQNTEETSASEDKAPALVDEQKPAEYFPVIEEGKPANLTIKYFDDYDETIPITGAEFEILQIANIGTDVTTGTNGAYIFLAEDLNFMIGEEEPDPIAYEQTVLDAYKANESLGFRAKGTIGNDGKAVFADIPAGAYLIHEVQNTRYHIKSQPFVASAPETNEESNSWNFDVVVNPKQIIAGDLEVSKVLQGNGANKNDVFTFQILITDGKYSCQMPDGSYGYVQSGDKIYIKGGEKFTIFDLPAGSHYQIIEIEANKNGYTTSYTNAEGTVKEKTAIKPVITNLKRVERTRGDTGAGNQLLLTLEVGGGLLALLIVLLYWKRKDITDPNEG